MYFSLLLATTLISFHWEATLISHLLSRKTIMPFTSLTDMYLNTEFRLALIPSTSFEDDFKFSGDKLWKKIYTERLEPYLKEYSDYPNHLSDMIHFIKNDPATALFDSFPPIR